MNSKYVSGCLLLFVSLTVIAKDRKARALSSSEIIEQIRPSVVQISYDVTFKTTPQTPQLSHIGIAGTGFFANDQGLVVTAKHVVDVIESIPSNILSQNVQMRQQVPNAPRIEADSIKVQLLVGIATPNVFNEETKVVGTFANIPATVIGKAERSDVAILKLSEDPFTGKYLQQVVAEIFSVKLKPIKPVVPKISPQLLEEGEAIAASGYPFVSGHLKSSFSELRPR